MLLEHALQHIKHHIVKVLDSLTSMKLDLWELIL